MQKTKQKKRCIIELTDGVYLRSECPVFSTEIIGEAKRLGKKEAIKSSEQLRWFHPAVQILEWKSPKPGRWKLLKPKSITHWMPLKASDEAKAVRIKSKFMLTVIRPSLELKLMTPPFLTTEAREIASNTLGVMRVLNLGKGSTMIDINPCFSGVADALTQRLESGLILNAPTETKGPEPVTDSEPTEQRGVSREVNYNYRVGLGLLMVAYSDLTSKSEGDTVTVTVTHRPSNWLKEDILVIEGWCLKTKSNAYSEVYWEWLFVSSEASKPSPATDSEARRLEATGWHYEQGLAILGDGCKIYNRDGETILHCKPTEGDFNKLVLRMESHGFKLLSWGSECQWSFDWNRWEAKTKETEAETDSTCSVCDSTPDQCHAEAYCPKTVS